MRGHRGLQGLVFFHACLLLYHLRAPCRTALTMASPAKRPRGAERLVLVTGAARGLGLGICRQVLRQDPTCEVLVTARSQEVAERAAKSLGSRARPLCCDILSESSCRQLAATVASVRGGRPLSLVHNAGVAYDLPWMPGPWPAHVARDTLATNLEGAQRLTEALLEELLDASAPGRVVFVSSGAGPLNMKKMSRQRRDELMSDDLTQEDITRIAQHFVSEYEEAAETQSSGGTVLPCLSRSGFWLQSYGFSKACLNALCSVLSRKHPSISCASCTPGFVQTDMVKTYTGETNLISADDGGDVPAWLACAADVPSSGCFYAADRSQGSLVAA